MNDSPNGRGDQKETRSGNAALRARIAELERELESSRATRGELPLRTSENYFCKIFNHAAAGIAIIDPMGRFVDCNPAYCDLLGYTAEEILKLNFENVIHSDDIAGNAARLQCLQKEEISSFEIEVRYVRKDGETVWVHKFASLLRNQVGEPETILSLVTNITQRREMELRLREAATRKDEFLAMLCHELRNPLAAIRYAVQMAKKVTDDAAREFANDVVDRQSKQLSRLVEDLLDVARIDRGRVALKMERLNLASVLARACDAAKPLIEQKHHSLSIQSADDHLWIDGDPARLEQIIGNLLSNAAKYTPEGGAILVACWRKNSEGFISITDNGVGISPALLPHVFDLFRQSEAPLDRSHGGLGIGLTIAKSLVEMHGGRITGESDGPGHGTTFTVSLPLIQETVPATYSAESEKPAFASKTIRILVVDDHVDTASALARILARRRCEVRVTHDGANALQVAEEFQPEIFLLDLGLPGMDGYNIARTLRANPAFANTFIVAISGYAQESDFKRSLAAGFDHHCPKPLDVTSLLDIIFSRFDVNSRAKNGGTSGEGMNDA
jgi:PAS domain S-box-containing protein